MSRVVCRLSALLAAGVLVLSSWGAVQGSSKAKKDEGPPPIEFTVLRDGKEAGHFSFKTVEFSGKIFTSSQLEMKGAGGTLAIMTHVEQDDKGKLTKYRKWVGNEGADPGLIAFWNGKNLRIVSKLPKERFTKDLNPADGFITLDQAGFHLYSFIAALWRQSQPAQLEAVNVHKGRLDKVTLTAAGQVRLKGSDGKEITADAVALKAKGFAVTIFVGDKPLFLGFQSRHVTMLRKGWSLLGVEEKSEVKELGGSASTPDPTATPDAKTGDKNPTPGKGDAATPPKGNTDPGGPESLPPLPE